jgi:hypothetical protein
VCILADWELRSKLELNEVEKDYDGGGGGGGSVIIFILSCHTHPASYLMGTRSDFPEGKAAWA